MGQAEFLETYMHTMNESYLCLPIMANIETNTFCQLINMRWLDDWAFMIYVHMYIHIHICTHISYTYTHAYAYIQMHICDWILKKPTELLHWAYSILLAQLMATLVHYTYIVPLPGLVDWSAFLERVFDPVNSWLRQWDPWRALHGRHGCEIHPRDRETSINAIQACLGLWLELLGPIGSPNSPNRFNLPPASHPPPPPTPLPLTCPPPIMCHQWYYSDFEKSWSKSSSVS